MECLLNLGPFPLTFLQLCEHRDKSNHCARVGLWKQCLDAELLHVLFDEQQQGLSAITEALHLCAAVPLTACKEFGRLSIWIARGAMMYGPFGLVQQAVEQQIKLTSRGSCQRTICRTGSAVRSSKRASDSPPCLQRWSGRQTVANRVRLTGPRARQRDVGGLHEPTR